MNFHGLRTREAAPADLYIACNAALRSWGGGVSLARGAAVAASLQRLSARVIGVRRRNGRAAREAGSEVERDEATIRGGGRFWMLRSLGVAGQLTDWLRMQAPPRLGFLAVSPFWVLAARAAWPQVPVAYLFPCLLANCLPRVHGSPGGISQRASQAVIAWIERRALRSASTIIAPTRLARDEIAAFAPDIANRIRIAAYGCHAPGLAVTEQQAARRPLGLDDRDFIVLGAGVFDRNKAFDLAITALPTCPPRVRLVLAGDGPERARLEADAARLGVASRVSFLGSQSDLSAALAACDAVVSTSRYDTYPNVLLEALAAGRPVIAPRHDPPHVYAGINELIARGGGVLYERTRVESLGAAIDALTDGRRYHQLRAEAHAVGASLEWTSLARAIGEFVGSTRQRLGMTGTAELEAVHGV